MAGPILEAQSITKHYPGVVALRDVSFQLHGPESGGEQGGEVHALCGENGAGKSTLIKVLGGVLSHETYQGQLLCHGQPVRFESIRDAEAAGIAVIHQELALVDEMTVAENVFLGNEPVRFGFVQHERMYVETQKVLERFKLDIDPTARVRELGMGQKQLVEIARALAKRARILILDEPTSALSDKEVRTLLAIILELRAAGVSSIYISHKLDEVFHLADRITVLRDGQSVFTTPSKQTDEPSIVQHMVGRRVDDLFPPRSPSSASPAAGTSAGAGSLGEVLLSVRGLSVAPRAGEPARLRDISLEVHAGQVLGIGGLMGAGRSELLMHLFGCYGVRLAGEVSFRGRPLPEDPAGNVRAGLVLVTEDRKRYGLCLDAMVGFNLSLSSLRELSRGGFIDHERELQENRRMVQAMRIKTASLEVKVGTLSGGNQQKVVLGRALMTGPKVVLLDEPTRGIDIGAKSEIYALVRELTEQGLGVVLVSSELPELIGLADRILMLSEGQLGGSFDAREATQASLLSAAMSKGRAPMGAEEHG